MHRRLLLGGLAATLGAPVAPAWAQAATAAAAGKLRSITVLDIELVDDQHNPATVEAQKRRLAAAHVQLQKALAERGLYRVIDPAPSAALQTKLRNQQEFLYRCADCAVQVGQLVGAQLAMTSWVQKVSELILNFNVEIHEVATEKVLFSKSVDLRGNDDVSWQRAVNYLVRDMAEKRAKNPRYGT